MPSAANIKVDKQIASETASVDSASNQQNTPIRQAIVIIEHKIRNLEKRKAKLESYRELQNTGKDLNQDQRVAVAKYDEVVQTLEFARELCKQFQGIAAVADKEAKKNARKETAARSQAEIAKVREVLLVQDALQQLGQEAIREDFLLGRNGAVALSEADLKLLDDIYPEVSPKHEPGSPANFTNHVQTAAEHLIAIVDGKAKEAFGSSYSHVKEIIGKIHESGYLDQADENNVHEFVEEVQESVVIESESKIEPLSEVPLEGSIPVYHVEQAVPPEEVPVVQAPPVLEQPQPQPFFQQSRPISEVLGSGTFFFLQDSELDSPEQTPQNSVLTTNAAIPSQTFTNQNFVNMPDGVGPRQPPIAGFAAPSPNPPPPIPMPPSHLPGMEFAGVAPMQGSPMAAYGAYQQPAVQDELHTAPTQQQPPAASHSQTQLLSHPAPVEQPAPIVADVDHSKPIDVDPVNSSGSPKNGPRPPRNNNQRRNGPQQAGYQQSYYNNNGYSSNRSRPSRGGGSGQGPPRNQGSRPSTAQKPKQAQH